MAKFDFFTHYKVYADWRDVNAYPPPIAGRELSIDESDRLTWEYLRRNMEYQRHWALLNENPEKTWEQG